MAECELGASRESTESVEEWKFIPPKLIADAFCRILNDWLTPAQIAEINRRNATPNYVDCCATHDFCDPNQAMIDAGALFGIQFDCRFNEDVDLIVAAWELARNRGYRVAGFR